ncbi:MAG: ATP-dependent zinc protease [Planctomycetota bacterium]
MPLKKRPLDIIGWREWVSLPTLGIASIKAKIDTGARTSALHAYDVRIDRSGDEPIVHFKVHPLQRSTRETVATSAVLIDRRRVRSSSGHSTRRPVIRVPMVLAGRRIGIELTLTNRDEMGFRMLLGRRALRKRFLVDVGKSYLVGRPPSGSTIAMGEELNPNKTAIEDPT